MYRYCTFVYEKCSYMKWFVWYYFGYRWSYIDKINGKGSIPSSSFIWAWSSKNHLKLGGASNSNMFRQMSDRNYDRFIFPLEICAIYKDTGVSFYCKTFNFPFLFYCRSFTSLENHHMKYLIQNNIIPNHFRSCQMFGFCCWNFGLNIKIIQYYIICEDYYWYLCCLSYIILQWWHVFTLLSAFNNALSVIYFIILYLFFSHKRGVTVCNLFFSSPKFCSVLWYFVSTRYTSYRYTR